jgi:hypothetical protein
MNDGLDRGARAVPSAKYRKVTVYLPGQPPIEINGAKVIGVGAVAPGMPPLVAYMDEMGRPHQLSGAIAWDAIFDDEAGATLYRPT